MINVLIECYCHYCLYKINYVHLRNILCNENNERFTNEYSKAIINVIEILYLNLKNQNNMNLTFFVCLFLCENFS